MRAVASGLFALGLIVVTTAVGQAGVVVTYDFETVPLGTATPFAITENGVTAAFSSSGDPGGFAVGPTFFSTLTGNVLLTPGPAFLNDLPLTIEFSEALSSISLLFALNASDDSVPLVLNAFLGGSAVGSVTATGTFPPGFFFPEGSIAFGGVEFDSVVLTTPAQNFAIDNIRVETAGRAVPEPSTIVLAGLGLVGVIGIRLSRRTRRPAA